MIKPGSPRSAASEQAAPGFLLLAVHKRLV
jgi:hypothetical protein